MFSGGICRANRVKKIGIRKNTIKNIAPQAGMYRWLQTLLCLEHRGDLQRKTAKAASEVAQAEPFFDERGVFEGGTQSKTTRSGGDAIVVPLRKKCYSADIT